MIAALFLTACSDSAAVTTQITVDGSSTVYPISVAVAEAHMLALGGEVSVSVSGTGGGFKKFCRGDVIITTASRPIRADERAACASAGIDYIELPIALDGIVVAVHPDNTWASTMTLPELKAIWEPTAQGSLTDWSQVHPGWPSVDLHLFSPGVDSGTHDCFTEAVIGEAGAIRGDITSSEDDRVLVAAIARDPSALGFFGLSYYLGAAEALQAVQIDPGDGTPVAPSLSSVASGAYQPLSRRVYLYVRADTTDNPDVAALLEQYLSTDSSALIRSAGHAPLPAAALAASRERLAAHTLGSPPRDDGCRPSIGRTP
jgi:phosphate transport system substrate-binding protein